MPSFNAAAAATALAPRRPTDPRAAPTTRKKLAQPVPASVAFQRRAAPGADRRGEKPCHVPPRNAAKPSAKNPAAQKWTGRAAPLRRFLARRNAPANAARPSAESVANVTGWARGFRFEVSGSKSAPEP